MNLYHLHIGGRESRIEFQSAHILPESEKCSHLHGHSYTIDLKIGGDVKEDMALLDFTALKNMLREIAQNFDHKMLIPGKDKRFVKENGNIRGRVHGREYLFPVEDCFILPSKACTAEALAKFVHDLFVSKIKGYRVEIGITEGFGSEAWYSSDGSGHKNK